MKTLIGAAFCATASFAFADYSLLDNEKFFRSGGMAENVVWGRNADGTKNATLVQSGDTEISIGANVDLSKYTGKDIEFVIVADGENVVCGDDDLTR